MQEYRRPTAPGSPGASKDGIWESVEKACLCLCGESAHDLGDDVQSDNAEDEDNGKCHDHNRVDLESGRLISVEPQHCA